MSDHDSRVMTRVVACRLHDHEAAALDAFAHRRGTSVSAELRRLIATLIATDCRLSR
jgi:hypothetical protein